MSSATSAPSTAPTAAPSPVSFGTSGHTDDVGAVAWPACFSVGSCWPSRLFSTASRRESSAPDAAARSAFVIPAS